MFRRKKYLFGSILILLAIGVLSYNAVSSFSVYYYRVSEFLAIADSFSGEQVRVSGKVVPGSIERTVDSQGQLVRFTIADLEDKQTVLAVEYRGATPDTFKDNADVVVEGKYHPEGVFRASQLSAKCPSRFAPAEE